MIKVCITLGGVDFAEADVGSRWWTTQEGIEQDG
jgi:hypothetical protein